MKKQFILLALFFSLISLTFWPGCKSSTDDKPDDGWTEEEEQAYLAIESLQTQCGQVFSDLVTTMDTSSAKAQLVEWFESDPSVAWAVASAQGVSVLYQNGLRGGIIIDPLDEDVEGIELPDTNSLPGRLFSGLKSIPGKKDVMYFNPAPAEFGPIFLSQRSIYLKNLRYTGMVLKKIVLNNKASLLELETLSDYGIIHYSAHGCAWPYEENISEVYAQTGEEVNPQTSLKYWKEIKENKMVMLLYARTNKLYYWVGPEFITDKNDFSQDTVLFYGEFCYGFLGGWPEIVSKFAKGVYMAADWSVAANYSATWGMDLIVFLCDTTRDVPISVNDWMISTPDLVKSYLDADNHTVSIRYIGDGTLTLWKPKIKLEIKSTEVDGAPITVPGKANTEYTFKCHVTGEMVENLEFIWDFGDGSSPQMTNQYNQISHTWSTEGIFQLKVEVWNFHTDELLGIPAVSVNIESPFSYINQFSSTKTAYTQNYSLPSTSIISISSPFFRVIYDTLLYMEAPPPENFTYKHIVNIMEKPLVAGESRTYQLTVTLGELTTSLPGTPSYNKVKVNIWDKNGSNYYEFDGLSPMTFNLVTDESHYAAISVNAAVWTGSGIPVDLFPLELTINKDY